MATLKWNIKLLGNLTPTDFAVWKAAAKIPECYVFEITDNASGWGDYPQFQEASIPIPEEENTIIITGKDKYDLFEPYCFAGHKCVMNTEDSDYRTGTKLLSTMLTSDGLLESGVIESISGKVDMTVWIKKNYPEAARCLANMDACTDPTTGYLNDTDDAVKLTNAMCKYILSSLGVCKSASGSPELASTEPIDSQPRGIPMMYYVMGAGALIVAGAGWYVWKNTR